jgi:hypothetical protein
VAGRAQVTRVHRDRVKAGAGVRAGLGEQQDLSELSEVVLLTLV